MLTEEQIEQILYPYISRQAEFNMSVIRVIADRLSRIADFDSLDTLERMAVMQSDIKIINDTHKKYIKEQKKHIDDDFWWVVAFIYAEAYVYYDTHTPLKDNKAVNAISAAAIGQAQATLVKLLNNPVFVIRDLKNPNNLKAYNLEKTYRTVINEAYSYRNLSDELRDIALKRTETQLFDSGIHYSIDNSSNSLESVKNANTSVRFTVLDGIKNLINQVEETMGKQFKADGLQLSAHMFPAPDHAPAQGHRFTFEEVDKMQSAANFEDVDGNKYVGFERNIGEWNCRHYFMRVKLKSAPTYTQKELDKILEENEKGYTDANGKHYTLYQCTQIQRRYEREIRNAKEKYLYAKTLGDKATMFNARNRVGALTTKYKQFSNACGISAKLERIKVKDYK